jgi:hypothetical protein
MSRTYTVRNTTTGAAATKSFISVAALANQRIKIMGILLGNSAATAAQGLEWEILRLTADATGTAQTPNPVDPDSSASRFTALSTITGEGTAGAIQAEFGFDVVGTYVLFFPERLQPEAVNSGILAIRKTVGADTSNWAITLWVEE